jgi:hypothetical protein
MKPMTTSALFESCRDSAFTVPWVWHELDIDDIDPLPGKVSSGETLIVEQHFGRKLELARFYQYPTHGGLLIGLAQARDSMVEEAIRTARDLFGGGDEVVAVLRPRLRRLPLSSCYCPELPPGCLPLVTTIALFNSAPHGEYEEFQSSAVVIWFQACFGLPADERVIMQLQDLDWPAHSRDWEY